MISVHEATKIIEGTVQKWRKVNVPLEKALGSVLRQSIVADTDFPPFDRVMMDGIAIRHRDLDAGIRSFKILGVQAAGTPQQSLECAGACLEVMTGAVLPMGADTVVPYEQLKLSEDGKTASLEIAQIDKGRNIHRRGLDKKQGEVLILPGTVMGAPEMAVAASVGASTIWVSHHPTVAIVSTGNELVDIHQTPPPHQIRRSNVYALSAELARIGLKADLYHFNDDKVSLQQNLGEVLEAHDIAIFSGAVSMGKFDFLPEVLVQLGVEKQFHKIAQKPGKPFWFGTMGTSKAIFAFPGNPVSTFLCFHKYLLPWLMQSLGKLHPTVVKATLAEDVDIKTTLTYFMQVKAEVDESGRLLAFPKMGKGSGDHANLLVSNAFMELPAGQGPYTKGALYPLILFRNLP